MEKKNSTLNEHYNNMMYRKKKILKKKTQTKGEKLSLTTCGGVWPKGS